MCSYLTVKFWVFWRFVFTPTSLITWQSERWFFVCFFDTWKFEHLSFDFHSFFPFVRNLNLIAKKFTYVWEKLLPSIWCSFLRKLMNGVFLKKQTLSLRKSLNHFSYPFWLEIFLCPFPKKYTGEGINSAALCFA